MTREGFWKGMTEEQIEAFLGQAESAMFGQMQNSKFAIVLAAKPDAKLAVELGAAILFDKPIIVFAPKGEPPVSDKLRAVAEGVIEVDFRSEQSKQAAQAEVFRILHWLGLGPTGPKGKVN
jgi:hypothetical protein